MLRRWTILAPMLALAACNEGAGPVVSLPRAIPAPTPSPAPAKVAPRPKVPRPPAKAAPPPAPQVLHAAGLESVIGAGKADLLRLLGKPRLDVAEGDAHKLQFAGESCVLDIYLYPQGKDGPLRATYAEARHPADARPVDRAACIAALRKALMP
jgi:hypothetical protein